jgi:hypothetical protein
VDLLQECNLKLELLLEAERYWQVDLEDILVLDLTHILLEEQFGHLDAELQMEI